MSYILHYSVKCDACRRVYKYNFTSKKDLLDNAKANGWVSSAGKHLCANCATPVIEKQKEKQKKKMQISNRLDEKFKQRQERMNVSILMRARGETYRVIGQKFEISPSRASQIVAKGHNIMAKKALIKTSLDEIGSSEAIKSLLLSGFEPELPPRRK
jgi:ferredoxin